MAGLAISVALIPLHLEFYRHAGPLWRDEVNLLNVATMPTFRSMFEHFHLDSFPFVWLSLCRLWIALVGDGDAAVRGYEAQTAGRLYARLDRHGASLLYGDFVTSGLGDARTLSAYSRSLTGVQQRFESQRYRVLGFGSRERSRKQNCRPP